jgi:hypothetical protein
VADRRREIRRKEKAHAARRVGLCIQVAQEFVICPCA